MTDETINQIDGLRAGQSISLTLDTEPRTKGPRDTVARLMRRDPANAKALRRAQELRRKRLNRYIRGNRLWTSREKAARVVRVRQGATWSMIYTPEIAPDLRSVAAYVRVATQ